MTGDDEEMTGLLAEPEVEVSGQAVMAGIELNEIVDALLVGRAVTCGQGWGTAGVTSAGDSGMDGRS